MHARLIPALTLGFSIFSTSADAREPTVPLSQRGVDRVAVKDSPALLGAVYKKRAVKSLTMAVERDWLNTAHAPFCKRGYLGSGNVVSTLGVGKGRQRVGYFLLIPGHPAKPDGFPL